MSALTPVLLLVSLCIQGAFFLNPDTFAKVEPEYVVYTSHAPFYLQAKAEDVQRVSYDDMDRLQGVQSTYWTGAAWRAQDSSMLWRFNFEVVLPLVEGL
jgi:hypothetical protein